MKILLAAAEVAPFAKVGGLGDVTGSLPKYIKEFDQDIRVIMPLYGCINARKYKLKSIPDSKISIKFGLREFCFSLKETTLPDSNVPVYFVVNNTYFGSHTEVYPKGGHVRFDQERFLAFGLATLELMKHVGFKPDIIHCNDWHTANIPVLLKSNYSNCKFYKGTRTVYSIHNLAYQGIYDFDILEFANVIDDRVYGNSGLEFYGKLNWMKGGINYSDRINTVSPTYAKEIQTPEYGENLDGLLRINKNKLTGILNGIDYALWDPAVDKVIPAQYSVKDLSGKKVCKKALQRELKLKQDPDVPLIGMISRLVSQKGLDLIDVISENIKDMNLQLVVLGIGEEKYEMMLKDLNLTSHNIRSFIGFNAELANKIYAGCDIFLMPSKFEPCGLSQLIALKYGTIPIARETGGLADTIIDYNLNEIDGNGFTFKDYDPYVLLNAINRALKTFKNKKDSLKFIRNAMQDDFGWPKSAQKYLELYKKAKGE